MLFPYSTDAPIYHWPFATVGLIVVNVYVFLACTVTAMNYQEEALDDIKTTEEMLFPEESGVVEEDPWEKAIDPWILHYGTFRPWEWVTSNFIHGDILHLVGNMAALWGLGLIVEGKVGWWRFLLIFFAIGIGECALEQALTFWMSGRSSCGASSIVFGLIAIALIWAPDDVSCILVLGYVWALEVSIITYAGAVLLLEVVMMMFTAAFGGFSITSAVLHLMGAGIGAAIGTAMVKLDWVDCEGFDLFAVMAGKEGQRRRRRDDEEVEDTSPEAVAQRKEQALEQIRHLIAEGRPQLAYVAHQRMRRDHRDWQLPAGDYLKLLSAYQKQELWADSIPLMVHYLRNYDQKIPQVRLQLARILIEYEDRPAQAEAVMARIPAKGLDERLAQMRENLQRKARQMRKEGTIEPAAEDW